MTTNLLTEIELPSLGKPYGKGPVASIRPMTAAEEKLLGGNNRAQNPASILETLLVRCVTYDVAVPQLVTGDRAYLLFQIRSNSYGSEYGFQLRCPNCEQQYTKRVDLETFPVRKLGDEWKEPFETTLPRSGATVKLRLLRGDDEQAIIQFTLQQKRQSQKFGVQEAGDPAYVYRIAKHIQEVKVDEKQLLTKASEILPWVENLVGMDLAEIRDAVADNDCGLEMVQDETCNECGYIYEYSLPWSNEFFNPRRPKR
jgi:hypothetical protein